MMSKKIDWVKLLFSLLLCHAAGFLGTLFTVTAIPTWYSVLIKPSFSPPNWLFGPVWLALYTLMGLSLYLVWMSHSRHKKNAIVLFLIQLFLNAIWTPVFFGLHSPLGGLIVIVLLWVAIILTMLQFRKISATALILLTPYLAWVSFAAALNYFIWQLN